MKVLTRKEVQKLLNISEYSTYKLLKEPDCPLLNVGGQYRIIEEDLINWLKNKDKKNKVG